MHFTRVLFLALLFKWHRHVMQWQKGLPIEVLPFAYKPVQLKLQALGGSADLRIAKQKAVGDLQTLPLNTLYTSCGES